jgi:hypothetical protein
LFAHLISPVWLPKDTADVREYNRSADA